MKDNCDITQDVLEILTHKVRVFRLSQIQRTWFPGNGKSLARAKRFVRSLVKQKLLRESCCMLHPEIAMTTALFRFTPGDDEPDMRQISRLARSRFHLPPVRTLLVTADNKASLAYGAPYPKRPLRASEVLHDSMLSEVFLNLRASEPRVSQSWIGEDVLVREGRFGGGGKVPDALVVRKGHEVLLECGGTYSTSKLRSVHEAFCEVRYEIW